MPMSTKELYEASTRKKRGFIIGLIVALLISCVLSLGIGTVDIGFLDVIRSVAHSIIPSIPGPEHSWYTTIVMSERFPRTLLCLLCGLSLAISGTVMQNILRNPLVSPFTLGVSSAASFGASIAIVLSGTTLASLVAVSFDIGNISISMDTILTVVLAFVAGLGSIWFILLLSRKKDISRSTIILSGVIISYLFQAGISFMKYISDDDALREITLWLMGGMWNASWGVIAFIFPVVMIVAIILESYAMNINVLAAGDDVAESLGVNVEQLRKRSLILCTLITSICISFTGVIGFVGLIAPHVCRMVIGNDNRYLIPASALFGGIILLVSDIISRIVIRPEELPVGIIMYILGGIFFIWLVTTKKKEVRM